MNIKLTKVPVFMWVPVAVEDPGFDGPVVDMPEKDIRTIISLMQELYATKEEVVKRYDPERIHFDSGGSPEDRKETTDSVQESGSSQPGD